MKTQCTGEQLEFHALGRRLVTGRFDDGRISSDAGGVLLREVDKRTGLTERISRCLVDFGGRPGSSSWNYVNPGRSDRILPVLMTEVEKLRRGDVFRHEMSGGGGYGDPLERDPESVLRGVVEEKVLKDPEKRAAGVRSPHRSRSPTMVRSVRLRQAWAGFHRGPESATALRARVPHLPREGALHALAGRSRACASKSATAKGRVDHRTHHCMGPVRHRARIRARRGPGRQ